MNAFEYGPKKLSPRAARAVALMKSGAEFVNRLERNSYTGRDQFQKRLMHKGRTVKGYGASTFYELRSMIAPTGYGTSVSTHYALRF